MGFLLRESLKTPIFDFKAIGEIILQVNKGQSYILSIDSLLVVGVLAKLVHTGAS